MNHLREGWEMTDPDQYQFCLKIDQDIFRYREYNWFEAYPDEPESLTQAEKDQNNWEDLTVDIRKYSPEEIQNHISAYYDSVEDIQKSYGNDWKQIVAECIFEQESRLY